MTQPPQHQDAASPARPASRRRPPAVIAAVLLMVPVGAVWLFCAVAFSVAMARTEGAAFFKYALAIPISGLCLFVAYMCAVSIHNAWRGTANRLQVPANFTFFLFAIVVIRLVVTRKLEFDPTMITPLVLGVAAAVALRLSSTAAAREWFDRRPG
jgi:hypothetical protein